MPALRRAFMREDFPTFGMPITRTFISVANGLRFARAAMMFSNQPGSELWHMPNVLTSKSLNVFTSLGLVHDAKKTC